MDMSWRYRKRRDEEDADSFDPFSFEFGLGFRDIDGMLSSMWKAASSIEGDLNSPNTIYYGYQLNVGPDGKPHVKEFGNVRPTRRGTFELGSRQPFVETLVDDKENVLKVVAEMPGVQREDIEIEVRENSLSIKAQNKDRNYDTEVPLETPVDANETKASYNNGVLEVKLKLKSPAKPKGVSVKVD